jgi:hypothetical protein
MTAKKSVSLSMEHLESRLVPTTAFLSNGVLTVVGDNHGNNINVLASSTGAISVTERGASVAITGTTTATTSNVQQVVELAGTGANNKLATDSSLGAIPDALVGNGTGLLVYNPRNNAPSTAFGSLNTNAVNDFISNPGGKDTFVGGRGYNLFDWEPGTGTDTYIGAGRGNTVLVVGNNNGTAENDTLTSNGQGEVTYNRVSPGPFTLTTTGIQYWQIEPSTGSGNNVTIGDLSGTATKQVTVDESASTVNAGAQNNVGVTLAVNGKRDTITEGAGPTKTTNVPPPTGSQLAIALQAKLK